jgi:hypothetical protein
VTSALGITINLDRSASDTAGVPVTRPVLRPSDREVERYAAARERLLAHPAGRWLWQLIETHREEIVELVTRHRPVTVTWHRSGGPALLAGALKSVVAGTAELPVAADGTPLVAVAGRMADALRSHGSAELRATLERTGPVILAALRDCTTLPDLLDRLSSAALHATTFPRVLA